MCDEKIARELISEAEKSLSISGATILFVREEMKEIEKKSRENIRKLSFLL